MPLNKETKPSENHNSNDQHETIATADIKCSSRVHANQRIIQL